MQGAWSAPWHNAEYTNENKWNLKIWYGIPTFQADCLAICEINIWKHYLQIHHKDLMIRNRLIVLQTLQPPQKMGGHYKVNTNFMAIE